MPQVFVYIRQDDYEKWKAIEKKSEFIHNALNGVTVVGAKFSAQKEQGGVLLKPVEVEEPEEEESNSYQEEIEARLVPVPGHPNAATDPVDEVTYKVRRVGGRLRIVD